MAYTPLTTITDPRARLTQRLTRLRNMQRGSAAFWQAEVERLDALSTSGAPKLALDARRKVAEFTRQADLLDEELAQITEEES